LWDDQNDPVALATDQHHAWPYEACIAPRRPHAGEKTERKKQKEKIDEPIPSTSSDRARRLSIPARIEESLAAVRKTFKQVSTPGFILQLRAKCKRIFAIITFEIGPLLADAIIVAIVLGAAI
jgi:hypothetical protein